MKKGIRKPIEKMRLRGEVSSCPACDYKDGFHVSFNLDDNSRTGTIILVCPQCSIRFSVGWPIQLQEKKF